MSTYGQVRFRLAKLLPGVDPDLLDGWIADRYQSILDRLDWSRRDLETVIQTVEPYEDGTVEVTNGSTAVTGDGTTFTSGMSGRQFRIVGRDEFYEFTYVSATTGTLDRAYEGESDTAASYKIAQPVYSLPSDCKFVYGLTSFKYGPLGKLSRAEMRDVATAAGEGIPCYWSMYMDTTGNVMQVELSPTPDEAIGLRLSYAAEAPAFGTPSATLAPWIRPTGLIAGVQADFARWSKDLPMAESLEARYENAVAEMIRTECHLRGPERLQVADRYRRRGF